MSETSKKYFLLFIVILGFVSIFFFEPYHQRLVYHNFADKRPWFWGLQNSCDVLSNIPFTIVGIVGLIFLKKYPVKLAFTSWLFLFIGVALVGIGSAYYHENPNNQTLVWDRLPLTVGFMGLLSALLTTYVEQKYEKIFLAITVSLGIFSVLYWAKYDDLRIYFYVQAIPLAIIPFILVLFRKNEFKSAYLGIALFFYLLAKYVEFNDYQIFGITNGFVSGHTLKHLFASLSPLTIAFMLRESYLRLSKK